MSESAIFLGSPRFTDAGLEQQARQDVGAAWRTLLAEGEAESLAGVEGEFAVGLHLANGRVFLAVDRFAIRSLCYRQIGDKLHFAARANELAALEPVAPVDPQAIFDYLYFHVIPSPRTIFKGILRLPPGHCAQFSQGQLTISAYWVPRFEEATRSDFDSLAAEFRNKLQIAVSTQLDGSKPACFLSGGTDSSTVAGMIGLTAGRTAATYSIGFDAEGYDEMEYARIAARRFGTEHHEYYVTPEDVVRGIPMVAAHYDQPFGNSSAVPAYFCARFAHDDGATRLLAGDGGDELFGGNTRYAKQRVFGWYQRVPRALKAALEPALINSTAQRAALLRKAGSYIEQARVPMPDRLEMYNLLLRVGPERVLQPGFLARVDRQGPSQHQRETWGTVQAASSLNRTLAFDWRYTLAEADLPKVCGTTQLAGVGVGFPFLDPGLLAFSMRLPTEYKLKGLKLRWFFKEALRGFLPEEIINKRKQGFGLPFGVWANRNRGLKGLAADALNGIAARGIVRHEFAAELLKDLLPVHPGYYGEMVWILIMLEHWLRAHAPAFQVRD